MPQLSGSTSRTLLALYRAGPGERVSAVIDRETALLDRAAETLGDLLRDFDCNHRPPDPCCSTCEARRIMAEIRESRALHVMVAIPQADGCVA